MMTFRVNGCYWSKDQFRNRGTKMLGLFFRCRSRQKTLVYSAQGITNDRITPTIVSFHSQSVCQPTFPIHPTSVQNSGERTSPCHKNQPTNRSLSARN